MTTTTTFLLLGVAALFFIIAYFIPQEKSLNPVSKQELNPYLSKNPLTQTETIFYHRLVDALPDYVVLAQVQLSSFIKVDSYRTGLKDYYRWFNPIAQQSVDFLICKKDFSVITAIELDDKSHYRTESIKRDAKKNKNLDAANVPLIRWHAESMPDNEIIRQAVLNHASESTITIHKEPAWVADIPPYFARKKQASYGNVVKNIAIWLAIAIAIIQINNLSKVNLISNSAHRLNNTRSLNVQQGHTETINQAQEYLLKQQQERAVQEASRIKALRSQQLINQQQEQQKLLLAREAALKEDAWNNYYKKTVECTNVDDMVKCGNAYIRNRQKFEYEWEHQRSKFR